MKVSNAQVRTIPFCALQGWPLSTTTPSWGHLPHHQILLRKTRANADIGLNPTSPWKKLFCPKNKTLHAKANYK